MSDTPRTDVVKADYIGFFSCATVPADFARTLERELTDANAKLSKLSRMIDIASQANDAASEAEVANSATFAEAMAHTNTEMVEAERDQLRAEVKKLKEHRRILQAEVERLKKHELYNYSWNNFVCVHHTDAERRSAIDRCPVCFKNDRDQWRAVSEQMAETLSHWGAQSSLAAYEKLKGESK